MVAELVGIFLQDEGLLHLAGLPQALAHQRVVQAKTLVPLLVLCTLRPVREKPEVQLFGLLIS